MATTSNKRTKDQRINDLEFVARERLRGRSLQEIADALASVRDYRLSRQQIWCTVKKLEEDWRGRARADVDRLVAKELAALDEQERELWAQWEKSKGAGVTETVEVVDVDGKRTERKQRVSKGQCGDVSFQNALLGVRDRRARLLGLDAPTKTKAELTGPDGAALQVQAKPTIIIQANGFEAEGAQVDAAPVEAQKAECPAK